MCLLNRIIRRNKGLGLLFILFISWSCSLNNSSEIKGKPVEVKTPVEIQTIGHWKAGGLKLKLLKEVIRQFEFENQDIKVNIKFPEDLYFPEKSDAQFVYSQLIQPTQKWDILLVRNDYNEVTMLTKDPEWPKKYVVDFSQFEIFRKNSVSYITSDDMKKQWHGIVPGHSIDGQSFVLWANKKLAEKIGIQLKPFDITFDEFENYFKAVSDYNKKNNTNIRALEFTGWVSANFALAQQLFASIIGDFDKLKDKSYSREKIKAWEEVLQATEKLSTYKLIDPNWRGMNLETKNYEKLLNEESLFTVNGTWMYNNWQKLDSVKFLNMVPLELPVMKPANTYIGEFSIPWIVPLKAQHKEEAIRYMLYWCRPDIADKWIRYTKSPTGVKSTMVQSIFGFDVYDNFDYTINKKYKGKKFPVESSNSSIFFGEKNATVKTHFEEVLEGSMTANEAMRIIGKQLVKN